MFSAAIKIPLGTLMSHVGVPGFESRLCGSGFLLAHTLGGSSDGLKCFRSCWLLLGWGFPLVAGADGRVTSRSYKGGLCTSETREMVGRGD